MKKKNLILIIIGLILFLGLSFFLLFKGQVFIQPKAEDTPASLALAPSQKNVNIGDTFAVDVMLDSGGQKINGADVEIYYNPNLLEVENGNLTSSNILPVTAINTVMTTGDANKNKIVFGASVVAGTEGKVVSGALATINLKAKAASSAANLNFNFSLGSTDDSNVTADLAQPVDILGSVTDANFVIGGGSQIPTVNLKANDSDGPLTINTGDSVNLTWTSANVVSCVASGDWSGNKDASGSESQGGTTTSKTFTLTCLAADQSTATDTVEVKIDIPAPTVNLKANNKDDSLSVESNSVVTLSWTTTNANSCTASGDWSGNKNTSGSEEVGKLIAAKTYTLTCANEKGSVSDTVVANIGTGLPKVDIKANDSNGPITIDAGVGFTLSWTSSNVTSCSASGHWSGVLQTSGSLKISKIGSAKQYILTCSDSLGVNIVDEVIVKVNNPTQTEPLVDLKINSSNSPVTIDSGNSVNLSWTATNASSCSASGGWSGAKSLSGSEEIKSITSSKSFTLKCSKNDIWAEDTVSVIVNNTQLPAPTVNLKANNSDTTSQIKSGQSVTLQWSSTNASNCNASGSWSGAKGVYGTEEIKNVTSSKTFILTCSRGSLSANDSVSIKLDTSSSGGTTGGTGGDSGGNNNGSGDTNVGGDTGTIEPPVIPSNNDSDVPASTDTNTDTNTNDIQQAFEGTGAKTWMLWFFYALIPISLTGGAVYYYYYYLRKRNVKVVEEKKEQYPF